MKSFFIIISLVFLLQSSAFTYTAKDMAHIDIYLHTVDTGNKVYDNFGHSALRVHDTSSGEDIVFNWGIFDFSSPVDFSVNFYRGILNYRLGAYPNSTAERYYRLDQRTVWEDKLNLSNEQKAVLMNRLVWNLKDENIEYQYHYFFNNCSTKIRDYLDEALGGELKKNLETQFCSRSFRDTVRAGYRTNPEIQLPLDVIMNSNIDRLMNRWEQMFLPINLRDEILNFEISGRKLVDQSLELYQFPQPGALPLNSFQLFGLLSVILCITIYFTNRHYPCGLAVRLLLIPLAMAIFLLGLMGLIMPLNWLFSAHIDLYHNANMWTLWFSDLLLLWPLGAIIFKGKKMTASAGKTLFWRRYINAHLIANTLFFILSLIGLFKQDTGNIALFIVPSLSLFLLLIREMYCKPAPPASSDVPA